MAGDISSVIRNVKSLVQYVRDSQWGQAWFALNAVIMEVQAALAAEPVMIKPTGMRAGGSPVEALENWANEAEAGGWGDKLGQLLPLLLQMVQWLLTKNAG